ncbi:MAG: hypothetical protein FJ399_16770 [Verrucomicrobia bacterium]|nr:hypothetical protein [Verrucomicrobiota bacterium]
MKRLLVREKSARPSSDQSGQGGRGDSVAASPDDSDFVASAVGPTGREFHTCECEISGLIDVIREFNRAVPFQPYEIRTNGGERLRVPHPDFVFVAPKGAWVMVADENDRPRHISAILIEEVAPVRPAAAGRRRNGKH